MENQIVQDKFNRLIDSLQSKYSRALTITSRNSNIITKFDNPIKLDASRNYEAALLWFSAYNTIFNIDETNNKFYFSEDSGLNYKKIEITTGAYEINQLNLDILKHIEKKDSMVLSANLSTGKSVIIINHKNFLIDFKQKNTFRDLLGYKPKILEFGENVSDFTVQIATLSTINVECDLIEGSYMNGKESSILYSFPAYTVPVGYKINERIIVPIYLPVNNKTIAEIRTRIIDEQGKLINFNEEEISMYIHLKQV